VPLLKSAYPVPVHVSESVCPVGVDDEVEPSHRKLNRQTPVVFVNGVERQGWPLPGLTLLPVTRFPDAALIEVPAVVENRPDGARGVVKVRKIIDQEPLLEQAAGRLGRGGVDRRVVGLKVGLGVQRVRGRGVARDGHRVDLVLVCGDAGGGEDRCQQVLDGLVLQPLEPRALHRVAGSRRRRHGQRDGAGVSRHRYLVEIVGGVLVGVDARAVDLYIVEVVDAARGSGEAEIRAVASRGAAVLERPHRLGDLGGVALLEEVAGLARQLNLGHAAAHRRPAQAPAREARHPLHRAVAKLVAGLYLHQGLVETVAPVARDDVGGEEARSGGRGYPLVLLVVDLDRHHLGSVDVSQRAVHFVRDNAEGDDISLSQNPATWPH
jgi:hypothetical protein